MACAGGSPCSSSAFPARRLGNRLQAPVKPPRSAFIWSAFSATIAELRLFANPASD